MKARALILVLMRTIGIFGERAARRRERVDAERLLECARPLKLFLVERVFALIRVTQRTAVRWHPGTLTAKLR